MGFKLNTNLINVEPLIEEIKDTGEIIEAAQEAVASVITPIVVPQTIINFLNNTNLNNLTLSWFGSGVRAESTSTYTQIKPDCGFKIYLPKDSNITFTFFTGYSTNFSLTYNGATIDGHNNQITINYDQWLELRAKNASAYIIKIVINNRIATINEALVNKLISPSFLDTTINGSIKATVNGESYDFEEGDFEFYPTRFMLSATTDISDHEYTSEISADTDVLILTNYSSNRGDYNDTYSSNLKLEYDKLDLYTDCGTNGKNQLTIEKDEVNLTANWGSIYLTATGLYDDIPGSGVAVYDDGDIYLTAGIKSSTVSNTSEIKLSAGNHQLSIFGDSGLQFSSDGGTTKYDLTKYYQYTLSWGATGGGGGGGTSYTIRYRFTGPEWLAGSTGTATWDLSKAADIILGQIVTADNVKLGVVTRQNTFFIVEFVDGTSCTADFVGFSATLTRGNAL